MRTCTEVTEVRKFPTTAVFDIQYTKVYQHRLKALSPRITFPESWQSEAEHLTRVLDIRPHQPCFFTGCLSREAQNKPDVFKDLDKIYHGEFPRHEGKFGTANDKYYIEDEHGRVELIGDYTKTHYLITGMICGVLGIQNNNGEFILTDMCTPTIPPVIAPTTQTKSKVAFISGLYLNEMPNLISLIMYLASNESISRLVICGNSLKSPPLELEGSRVLRHGHDGSALSMLDNFLYTVLQLLPVHIMPGHEDPSPIAFPQEKLHPVLFSKCKKFLGNGGGLYLETSPVDFKIDGTHYIGTSGQPVKDMLKYTEDMTDMQLLEETLKWRHIAPSAPYSLFSYPFVDSDPLILNELPNVYFSGNSRNFETKIVDNVRLVCVPEFLRSGQVILVENDTLDVHTVNLKI